MLKQPQPRRQLQLRHQLYVSSLDFALSSELNVFAFRFSMYNRHRMHPIASFFDSL